MHRTIGRAVEDILFGLAMGIMIGGLLVGWAVHLEEEKRMSLEKILLSNEIKSLKRDLEKAKKNNFYAVANYAETKKGSLPEEISVENFSIDTPKKTEASEVKKVLADWENQLQKLVRENPATFLGVQKKSFLTEEYGFAGSSFLAEYKKKLFIITAAHVVEKEFKDDVIFNILGNIDHQKYFTNPTNPPRFSMTIDVAAFPIEKGVIVSWDWDASLDGKIKVLNFAEEKPVLKDGETPLAVICSSSKFIAPIRLGVFTGPFGKNWEEEREAWERAKRKPKSKFDENFLPGPEDLQQINFFAGKIQGGCSGSPIIGADGKVIGVVTQGNIWFGHFGMFVPASDVISFLDANFF